MTRTIVLFGAVTLIAACSRSGSLNFPDDGFINFEPSIEMFPDPPVVDADVSFGFSGPQLWQWRPKYCPRPSLRYGATDHRYNFPVDARNWHGVRYDWVDEGVAKAWIVTEQTIGFADDNKRDRYLDELRSSLAECGWEYDETEHGYNAIPIELTHLPQGSVAYRSERNPNRPPTEVPFQSFTVLIPGDRPNHLIVVSWIDWGTDVSAESVEAVAAALATEANRAALSGTTGNG